MAIKTVDDYIKAAPPEARAVLRQLQRTIRAAAPAAEEVISYKIPLYRYYGHLVGFAAFKNHIALFTTGSEVLKDLKKELAPFDVAGTKTTIRFSPKNPLPASLVKKIVRYRMQENKVRAAEKKR